MRVVGAAAVVLASIFVFTQGGYGQGPDDLKALRDEVQALKAGQAAIQKELETIKNLLTKQAQPQAPAPFKEAILAIDSGYVKGDKRAKLVFMEFSEYQ